MSDLDIVRRLALLERRLEKLETSGTGYEYGTFTPTYYGSSTAGVTTYTTQFGVYVRMGALCHIWLRVDWSAVTGTGNGLVGGLPYTAAASSQTTFAAFTQFYSYTNAGLRAYIFGGNQFISLFDQVVGAFASAPIDSAATLIISGAYPV